jgi:ABC-type transporter Mla MlaB component
MGLVVQRRVELNGSVEYTVDDPSNEILRNVDEADSEALVLLSGLGAVCDTAFNQVQLPRVIEELRHLAGLTKGESLPIVEAMSLAEQTLGMSHRYLVFVGD